MGYKDNNEKALVKATFFAGYVNNLNMQIESSFWKNSSCTFIVISETETRVW